MAQRWPVAQAQYRDQSLQAGKPNRRGSGRGCTRQSGRLGRHSPRRRANRRRQFQRRHHAGSPIAAQGARRRSSVEKTSQRKVRPQSSERSGLRHRRIHTRPRRPRHETGRVGKLEASCNHTVSAPRPSIKANFRYEGKTFNEWRSAWQTELSTEKRIEAVKALAAFGANGYGKEAAEAILEVAGQYDWKSVGDNKDVEPLQNACLKAFGGVALEQGAVAPSISAIDALPSLSAAIKSGNLRQKLFATWVLPYITGPESVALGLTLSKDEDATIRQYALRSLPNPGSKDYDVRVSARVREALSSNDPGDVAAAMSVTFPFRDKSGARAPILIYPNFPSGFSRRTKPCENRREIWRQASKPTTPAKSQRWRWPSSRTTPRKSNTLKRFAPWPRLDRTPKPRSIHCARS